MPGRCQDPPLERCRGEHFVRVSENGTRKVQERAAGPNKPKTRSESWIDPVQVASPPRAFLAEIRPTIRLLAVGFNGQIRKGTPFSLDSAHSRIQCHGPNQVGEHTNGQRPSVLSVRPSIWSYLCFLGSYLVLSVFFWPALERI